MIELIITAAMFAASVEPSIGSLNLTCSGQIERVDYLEDEQLRSQDGDVRLYLADQGGTAEMPRFMGGAKEGRLIVSLFTVTDSMITGKINYGSIGNAKMRLDRIAGTVAITGPRGNFSGRCQPFDPATTVPKF